MDTTKGLKLRSTRDKAPAIVKTFIQEINERIENERD